MSWVFGTQRGISQAGRDACLCVGLCLSVCLTKEYFHGGYYLSKDPKTGKAELFLKQLLVRVYLECGLLGQGVVAQEVDGHSAFKMSLVTGPPRKPSVLACPPLVPFLLCSTHSVSLETEFSVPPPPKSQYSVRHFVSTRGVC